MKKHNYKIAFLGLITLLTVFSFMIGCQYAPLVGLLGTESYHEQKVPAEYDLAKQIDKKILVFVDQPAWLDSEANLRFYLTKTIRQTLMGKTKLTPENLISYEKLVDFRSSEPNFSSMSPVEVGRALDANMVLLILIEDYNLNEMAQTGYLMGNLDTRAVLYDTQTGEKLWPAQEPGKSVRVGFEIETRGKEAAVSRLAVASAHCTTRYLYDCKKALFRIADDRTRIDWENQQ